jgi:hypothetical protein
MSWVQLQAEPALMYDSVYVFAKALAAMDRGHVLRPANLSCELEEPWKDGLSLYNYISSVSNDYKFVMLHPERQGKVTSWLRLLSRRLVYWNTDYIYVPSGSCWGSKLNMPALFSGYAVA